MKQLIDKYPAVPYVAPFAAFILFLGLKDYLPFDAGLEYPLRVVVVSLVIATVAIPLLRRPPSHLASSIGLGILVFVIWVLPDQLFPAYRHHWLFENAYLGSARSSLPERFHADLIFLTFRFLGTALIVPIIEELFWRGWLMRYLIQPKFEKIPLGTYSSTAFWLTAILFATEHGSYWDVGLLAGVIYNGWMLRTRNLTDCIVAHAVTNLCLGAYVVGTGNWQYWL